MENHQEWKREARKQYLRYFRLWFVAVGILAAVLAGRKIRGHLLENSGRGNLSAPAERVYDYAQILLPEEEEQLRELIREKETRLRCDIVLVTVREPFGEDGRSWEDGMRSYADDFYDRNHFGYERADGTGVLLLDNWLESQEGSWLSTCGAALEQLGSRETDRILDAVAARVESSPLEAYRAYVEAVSAEMNFPGIFGRPDPAAVLLAVLLFPAVVLGIFVGVHLYSPIGRKTVGETAYVSGGKPKMNVSRDVFVRKQLVTRRIQKGGGHGGAHASSGGVRHGGGGRRR
ncbi:MAG: TPM domain-containing protein [Clostridium sp.]|jgi:uncharacterized protein|nr:TPM domain-containing protein [Clostridium sp.]